MAELRPYSPGDYDEVVELLVSAFLENPLHLVLFPDVGPEGRRQRRSLFAILLDMLGDGPKVVATDDARIVGFAHWESSPGCRPSSEVLATAAPRLAAELDSEVLGRVIAWRRAWGEQDPESPHSHFGPLAVRPEFQGHGIGRALLAHYCSVIDASRETGYLETERPRNVAIYRNSGFEVTAEVEVLGVPCWFMTRPRPGS